VFTHFLTIENWRAKQELIAEIAPVFPKSCYCLFPPPKKTKRYNI